MTLKEKIVRLFKRRRPEIPEGLAIYEITDPGISRHIAHWAMMPRKIFRRKKWD